MKPNLLKLIFAAFLLNISIHNIQSMHKYYLVGPNEELFTLFSSEVE